MQSGEWVRKNEASLEDNLRDENFYVGRKNFMI
jgi:hypothetical protein